MRLQAALNGSRMPRDHPAVPVTPEALARDAAAVQRAGAQSLHFHPRDGQGRESLEPADVGAAIEAVRERVPGMPLGVSTGAWIRPGGPARLMPIRRWQVLPDYVSVNVHEPEAENVIALMQARGVGVEAGIWTRAAAQRFVATRLPRYCLRALVEMTSDDPAEATAEAEAVLGILRDAGVTLPVLLHGQGGSVWTMVEMAAGRGLATRVGFEDGHRLPEGALAASNAAMVAAAARIYRR